MNKKKSQKLRNSFLQTTVRSPESAAVMWMARKIKKQN